MDFVPAWKDTWLLLQFAGLFGVSGWSTYRLAVGRLKEPVLSGAPFGARLDLFTNLIGPALLSAVCGLMVTSCFLMLSAQLGVARIRYLFVMLALYSLVCLAWLLKSRALQWRLPAWRRLRPGWSDLWLAGILLLGVFTFGRTAEYVASQRDPGEHANIAVRLAQEQSLRFNDPDFRKFDEDRQKLFLPVLLENALYLEAVPGFSLLDAETGEMLPQYLHLFPLWLSLAFKIWRFDGLFGFNVLLGLLSLLLVVALAVEVFRSRTVGLVASGLLCLNLGQIWLVRSPFSETLAQVLLLAGVWMLTLAVSRRQRGLGFLSGLVFGLSLMVRIDSVLAILAVSAFLILARTGLAGRAGWAVRPVAAGLTVGVGYSLTHIALFAYPYVLSILHNQGVLSFLDRQWRWLLALALLATIAAWSSKPWMRAWQDRGFPTPASWGGPAIRRRIVFVSLSGLLIIAFAWGYFFRPMMDPGADLLPLAPPHQGFLPYYDELNLVRLGWYLSPLGLCLALLGAILALRQVVLKQQVRPLPLLLLLAAFLLFYGYKSRAFPDNYWVIRRYAEVAIPAMLILAGLAMQRLYRLGSVHPRLWARSDSRRFLLRACGLGVLTVMAATQTVAAWPFLRQAELGGSWSQMAALASRTREADVILFEHGRAQEFFLGPLRNVFGQTAFPLAHTRPDPDSFERVVGEFLAEKRRVFIISSEEWTSLDSSKYFFEPRERFYFASDVVERTFERLPQRMQEVQYSLQIYEVKPRPQAGPKNYEALIAHSNFGYASEGFHQSEFGAGGNAYRWSQGDASVELSEIDGSYPAVLIARLARPDMGPATESPVGVRLNGQDLGAVNLSPRFKDYKIPIRRSQLARGERNRVEFQSHSFNPAALQGWEDTRDLGFMLDCIKLQSLVPMGGTRAYQVDFGTECDGTQRMGFYPTEADGYSWAGIAPSLVWPFPLDPGRNYRLVIRTVKSNPDPEFRQFLTVWVNEVKLDTRELIGVGDQFRNYAFPISPGALDRKTPTIRLRVSPVWNPSLAGVSPDYRNLGSAVQWLRIEEL
ncbi:MAG: hypothetical protein OXG96_15805 [Acidobacteria bacterium]|nr:hypothetical protein [Acidobacteriota bacterium]